MWRTFSFCFGSLLFITALFPFAVVLFLYFFYFFRTRFNTRLHALGVFCLFCLPLSLLPFSSSSFYPSEALPTLFLFIFFFPPIYLLYVLGLIIVFLSFD